MTTLITGGSSATGTALAKLLKEANRDVLFASRSGNRIPDGFDHVKFDWTDTSTFSAPFDSGKDIQFVYLLLAGVMDPLAAAKPFIEIAVGKGVKRFVLLSAAGFWTEKGPRAMAVGQVHTYLDERGLDYVVLRPTVFSENFLKEAEEIKRDSVIRSIHPKGRVPFVAVQDIAQAAFDAITNVECLPCREPTLIGPELVTFDEVAAAFSKTLGRTIAHRIISSEEQVQRYMQVMPEQHARLLVQLEEAIEEGSEEKHLSDERKLVGKVGIRQWVEAHKDAFTE